MGRAVTPGKATEQVLNNLLSKWTDDNPIEAANGQANSKMLKNEEKP